MSTDTLVLEGRHARLLPLSLDHLDGLCAVGFDPDLWKWTTMTLTNRDEMRAYVEAAIREGVEGRSVPFATVVRDGEVVAGSTRFCNMDLANRHLEIGWTWVAGPWQRTAVNTEAKLLMLRHAFETWKCLRVELKTDALNERSRAAILRIGAREEGLFRKHMVTDSGRIRDSVYFSIVDDEWPDVKRRLESRLATGSPDRT